jgi:hypothetical protein
MTNTELKLLFNIKDVGYNLEVRLEDNHLIILKHQEVLFEGTVGGLMDIIDNEKINHHNAGELIRVYTTILDMIVQFRILLKIRDHA